MTRAWILVGLLGCTDKEQDADTTRDTNVAVDEDADGYSSDTDCDDSDSGAHPGAEESCDGVDNDCDGVIDEDVTSTFYADSDGDGYGNVDSPADACEPPAGHVSDSTDCDDADASASPAERESCDGVDNDCDGEVDEGATSTFYADSDGDGFGDANAPVEGCDAPSGHSTDSTDCDDTNSGVYPGAAEICDGADNDCDSSTAEDGLATWRSSIGSVVDMTADFNVGIPSTPTSVVLYDTGTLHLCGGTWYTRVFLWNDVDIVGVGGAAANIIDAAGAGSVVSLREEKRVASLTGLTLQNGAGDGNDPIGFGGGGGIDCKGNTSELTLNDLIIQDNTAGVGGGIAVEGCTIDATSVSILNNDASYSGGGVAIFSGEVTFNDSLISDNEAVTLGGGVHVAGYRFAWAYLDLNETLITRNDASYGSGLSQYNTSAVTCTGSNKGTYGFTRNGSSRTNPYNAAVFITNLTSADSFTATDCDFGASTEDNQAGDIYHAYDGRTYDALEADEDFVCDDLGCY